jgi:transposase
MDDDESKIAEKYEALRGVMDEQIRRLWAATEARALGYGGVSTVARAVGLTRPTITAGMKELGDAREIVPMAPKHRVRREGAGRPRATDSDAGLRPALEELVEPATRGHPMSPLRWTCKSVRTLATELTRQGHAVSHQTVSEVLQNLGYSLQANRKTREGAEHPDRNAQFEHIAQRAKEFQRRGQPVISVDTKKKERASSKGWLVQQETVLPG